MAQDRDPRPHQALDDLRHLLAPSSFTASAPLLEEALRGEEGPVQGGVGEVGEVGHEKGLRGPPAGGLGVVEHLLQGHGHRGGVAQDHHPQGVPHQNGVHPGRLGQAGRGVVVGGEVDEPLALGVAEVLHRAPHGNKAIMEERGRPRP